MGREFVLICTKCKRKVTARDGIGREPLYYAKYLYKRIMAKKSEDKLRKELKVHPGCLPDPTWDVYMCSSCGYWMSDQAKNIVCTREKVIPAGDGMEEFRFKTLELVKRMYKKCPRCEKRMHKFKGKKSYLERETAQAMKCPYCGGKTKIIEELFWD